MLFELKNMFSLQWPTKKQLMERTLQLSYLYLIAMTYMIPSMIPNSQGCLTKSKQSSYNAEEEHTIIEFIKTTILNSFSNERIFNILTKPYSLRLCNDMKSFCNSDRQPNPSLNIGKDDICNRLFLDDITKSDVPFCSSFLGIKK